MPEEKDKTDNSASDISNNSSPKSDVCCIQRESDQECFNLVETVSKEQAQDNAHTEALPAVLDAIVDSENAQPKCEAAENSTSNNIIPCDNLTNEAISHNENKHMSETESVAPQSENTGGAGNRTEPDESEVSVKEQGNCENEIVDLEKKELLDYIAEAEIRLNTKTQLRERNQNVVRPDEAVIAKLDSSLKKNTAFVRKLRNFTAQQYESLMKDMSSLNLSKYISEVASALVEAKLKLTDVPSAVLLCSEMHCIYPEFSKVLLEHWVKTLSLKKDEKIANPSKLRVDLRFYGDLVTSGIFPYKEALPLLGNILTVLATMDKEEHINLNIILNFCKHCGEDYAGLIPQTIRKLSDKYNIPVPKSSVLPPEKQKNVRSLLRDYYSSLCKHLQKEHAELLAFERQNRRILQTKGELNAERKEKGEALAASLQKLLTGTQTFAEILDEEVPPLPEDVCQNTEVSGPIGASESDDGSCAVNLWEDEETQRFYQDFPNLKDFLPNVKFSKDFQPQQPTITEEKLDEELKEEELEEEIRKEEETPAEIDELDDTDSNLNSKSKILLDAFLNHLPNCVNREMIDNAAIEFLMYHNTKHHRRKLVKVLFGVPRTRLDLLPFYARLVAILNPVMPEVAADLGSLLKHDFKYHVRKKDQINIESKIKVIRFIGELVKFQLYSKIEGLYCLKILLHDFTHHHIEMACNLLESCGRFFFRNPDTHQRTKVYLEQMMRKKSVMALDSRYVTMIENAYYYVSPPDTPLTKAKERPPLHQFIRHLLYQELMKPGTETESSVLTLMRKLDWQDPQVAAYAIKCLTNAWNVKYFNIRSLANLLAGLVEYQEFVGTQVVDGVMEDIRIGLEINQPKLNQRRVAMVKYLGELYNYRMIESSDVFKVLYTLISFGVTFDHDNPSPVDPPDNLFRIRLVCVLLETCGQFFNHGLSKTKLDYFFIYFQNYFWFKYSDPYWTTENPFPVSVDYMFRDIVTGLRPNLKLATSYQETKDAVHQIQNKLLAKHGPIAPVVQEDSDELETIIEVKDEDAGTEDEDEWESSSSEDGEGSENEGVGSRNSEPEGANEPPAGLKIIERERNRDQDSIKDWGEEEDLDMDSDADLSDSQNVDNAFCPEEDDFLNAFERMVSDNMQDRLRENVKLQQVDISVPIHFKSNTKKTYEQLQEPESDEKSVVNFVLMLRKGNKQQYKSLAVPIDSDLALNLRSQEKAERVEMEQVKRLTLDINDRLEEEDYQDQLAQVQRPTVLNLNRERRHKYQHPKGAPDADLIFGRKKLQR